MEILQGMIAGLQISKNNVQFYTINSKNKYVKVNLFIENRKIRYIILEVLGPKDKTIK